MNRKDFVKYINHKLIISCQAVDDEPLNDVHAITLMAQAVIEGGAKILRLSQYDHIKSIKTKFNNIPIIGLIKKHYPESEVIITASIAEIDLLLELKVDCIALDCTNRVRPKNDLKYLIKYIRSKSPETAIMGDCATIDDVENCNKLNLDVIGTTLHGYTTETKNMNNIGNDYEFIRFSILNSSLPIIAEGGIWEPYQVKQLFQLGCHSVVVGSAITRPKEIAKRFFAELDK